MLTRWGKELDREHPLPEYPRPQMVRESYLNLNGPWDYAITASQDAPQNFDGTIIVPFSPETELSGVERTLRPGEYLWYQRSFLLPEGFNVGRVLLHLGAVDQIADVYINGLPAAHHVGGYLPIDADITDMLTSGVNMLTVCVTDDTDGSYHTRGKQKTKPGTIWYGPQSGIWQTVWLESVPPFYIKDIKLTPRLDEGALDITVGGMGQVEAVIDGAEYTLDAGVPTRLLLPELHPWSPEEPYLYDLTLSMDGGDRIKSYFALRKFSVEHDNEGIPRLFLNNAPCFHNGLLDQGYWPDGLYTAPSDEALIYDIETAKAMGFNMLRKHIKVEPMRWYYHCDRLGMLVWQDMPNGGGSYSPLTVTTPLFTGVHMKDNKYRAFARSDAAGRAEFQAELREMIEHLYNCPCIAMWVPFNEGWGQFDAAEAVAIIKDIDDTRTIDHASGWHDQGISDVKSHHVYFDSYDFKPDKLGRAVVLSEFGGYVFFTTGHTVGDKAFGYKKFDSRNSLHFGIKDLYEREIFPAVPKGLSAAVYTQLTDVETEVNGLITYDREMCKIAPELMRKTISVKL